LENAKRTNRGLVLTLGTCCFETGRRNLKPGAVQNLSSLVFFRDHPDRNVIIEGHTDDVGGDAYNQQLSQQRAESVRSLHASSGIGPERIIARGMGEALPVAPTVTKPGGSKTAA
jgi:outer membrane protein OmpA-like peptidoglycan-associated protein